MDKKIIIGIVAAVVVIAVAAAAVYVYEDDDDSDDDEKFTILVEDQKGVYFWTEAKGDTLGDALKANSSPNADFTTTAKKWGTSVDGINGLNGTSTTVDGTTTYLYWSLYLYNDETKELTYSEVGVDEVKLADNDKVAFFYVESSGMGDTTAGGPKNVTVPSFEDPEVYDGEKEDVTFTIQSSTGMHFQIAGDGDTVYAAFKDAAEDYGVPYLPSTDKNTGDENGIKSMFELATTQVGDDWVYWQQYVSARGVWTLAGSYMSNIESKDCDSMCIYYGSYGSAPTVAAPAPEGYTGTILFMDQYGVYTWSQVDTETYGDAIKDNKVPGIDFTSTQSQYGTSVSAINGLASVDGANADGSFTYWSLMVYDGSKWTYAASGPDGLKTAENRVVGYFYATTTYDSATGTTLYTVGGPENLSRVMPSITDVGEIAGQDTDSVKMIIQSKSGFYINIEGDGDKLDAAFKDACDDYRVPYVTSESKTYGTSLDSIFGMAMTKEGEGDTAVYTWWNQCYVEDGKWVANSAGMGNTDVVSGTLYGFVYSTGALPTAPTA